MSLRRELLKFCHKVHEKGLVAAYDGNLSLKINENEILITPSAVPKAELKEDDLLLIDSDGRKLDGNGKVSTEVKMHLFAYERRPEINAVVHCHPVYASVLAASGITISEPFFPEVLLILGDVPLCKYATPSTSEVIDSLEPYILGNDNFLLSNHGALTLGATISDAYYKMEKLEHTANIYFQMKLLGKGKRLTPKNINKLMALAASTYGLSPKSKYYPNHTAKNGKK